MIAMYDLEDNLITIFDSYKNVLNILIQQQEYYIVIFQEVKKEK